MQGKFCVGTSGWSYRHWVGKFYPQGMRNDQFLSYYTQHFGCVELNASFYRLPKPAMVEGWVAKTPEHFRFAAKLSRLITHQKRLVDCREALVSYFEVMSKLTPRLGPILIQLPPSFRFDGAVVEPFLTVLRNEFGEYTYALEARNDTWFTAEAQDLLRRYNIAWVIADSGGRFPKYEGVTADFVYLRFHGPGALYASDYPDEQLAEYATKVARWLKAGLAVWAFFNNDVGGYAVKNAMTLREMVAHAVEVGSLK